MISRENRVIMAASSDEAPHVDRMRLIQIEFNQIWAGRRADGDTLKLLHEEIDSRLPVLHRRLAPL
jgi:hypothetical protein